MVRVAHHERVDQDVLEAIEYYLQHEAQAALSFVDALEQTYRQIQQPPATGSPRYAHELNLPGLQYRNKIMTLDNTTARQ